MVGYGFKIGRSWPKLNGRVSSLLFELSESFDADVPLLLHYEFALLDECAGNADAFRNVQDEKS